MLERPVGDSSNPPLPAGVFPTGPFHGPVLGGEERLLADATQSADEQAAEVAARVNRFSCAVCCPRAVGASADRLGGVADQVHRYRPEPHQRAVPSRKRVRRPRVGVAAVLGEVRQRLVDRVADIEAVPPRGQVALVPPPQVTAHLIGRVESAALDQALCQAQGHRRVVSPLARLQPERAAAGHVTDRLESTGPLELQRRAKRIPRRQPQQTTAETIPGRYTTNQHRPLIPQPSQAANPSRPPFPAGDPGQTRQPPQPSTRRRPANPPNGSPRRLPPNHANQQTTTTTPTHPARPASKENAGVLACSRECVSVTRGWLR